MEPEIQTHELRFAWRQRQVEIDQFVRQLPSKNMSTAFVAAQHAAGKSTTMLAHISDIMQPDKAFENTAIVYFVSSRIEVMLHSNFVSSPQFKAQTTAESCFTIELRPTKVGLISFDEGISTFKQLVSQQVSLLLVVDLEISPTTNGEVLLGLAMEWAAEVSGSSAPKPLGHGLMVLSPYTSPRTLEALTRVVGHLPSLIQVPKVALNLGMEILEEDGFEQIKKRLEASKRGIQRRLLIHSDSKWDQNLFQLEIDIHGLRGTDLDAADAVRICAQTSGPILVDHQFPCSTFVDGLTHVFSSCQIEEPTWKFEVMQPVVQRRDVTTLEHLRELSWAHKARVPDDVMFYRPERHLTTPLSSGIDVLGPALTADRYRTVLEYISRWPGRSFTQMPTRLPHDLHLLRYVCQKLELFGCIKTMDQDGQPAYGVYQLTGFGNTLLSTWRSAAFATMDFHVLHLVVTTVVGLKSGWSTAMVRVGLRLAAIMSVGGLITKVFEETPLSLEQLEAECSGVGKTQAIFGYLWASLGVWQKAAAAGHITTTAGNFLYRGPVRLNKLRALRVQHLVLSLEQHLQLPRVGHELDESAINDDEIQTLEVALLNAHIDQVATYNALRVKWFDSSCVREVQASDSDLLDPDMLSSRDEFARGFFAIYTTMSYQDDTFVIGNITAIPQRALRDLANRTGLPFMQAIASHYPTAL
ncbi:hypothetical protein PG984_011977 [Apiospora sp. TS-2023a]